MDLITSSESSEGNRNREIGEELCRQSHQDNSPLVDSGEETRSVRFPTDKVDLTFGFR